MTSRYDLVAKILRDAGFAVEFLAIGPGNAGIAYGHRRAGRVEPGDVAQALGEIVEDGLVSLEP